MRRFATAASTGRLAGIAAVLSLALLGAVACGDDEDSGGAGSTTSDGSSTVPTSDAGGDGGSGTSTSTSEALAEEFPCDLFDVDELSALAGGALEPGDAGTNVVDEDGVTYDGPECWFAASEQGGTEVRVQVSRADDFPSGSVECPPSPGDATEILNLGDSATWSVTSSDELQVGTLRICTADAFVQVVVDGSAGTEVQPVALQVGQLALGAL